MPLYYTGQPFAWLQKVILSLGVFGACQLNVCKFPRDTGPDATM